MLSKDIQLRSLGHQVTLLTHCHILTYCYTLPTHSHTLLTHSRTLMTHCRTLTHYHTLLTYCCTLMTHCHTLMIHYPTLMTYHCTLTHCHTLLTHCHTLKTHCHTLMTNCPMLMTHCCTLLTHCCLCPPASQCSNSLPPAFHSKEHIVLTGSPGLLQMSGGWSQMKILLTAYTSVWGGGCGGRHNPPFPWLWPRQGCHACTAWEGTGIRSYSDTRTRTHISNEQH